MTKRKPEFKPANYRKLFFLGIVCMIVGVPLSSALLIGLGSFLMIIGYVNKHKWPERPGEKVVDQSAPELEEKADEVADQDYDR